MKNILRNKYYLYMTEFFSGMRVIDEIIREEIGYYKDLFRKEGIQGILQAL